MQNLFLANKSSFLCYFFDNQQKLTDALARTAGTARLYISTSTKTKQTKLINKRITIANAEKEQFNGSRQ